MQTQVFLTPAAIAFAMMALGALIELVVPRIAGGAGRSGRRVAA